MSADDGGGAGRREVAWRLFAAEYDDADFSYSESDEERAPNYVVTPSGARVNRLFVVGVLTEVEQVNEEVLRARVVDPTGAFVVYAGQYQPDEMAFLERADPPTFVAVTGKARTFEPDDADTVYTSVRPESINEVDAEARDRWVVSTAEQTLHRVATMRDALQRDERGDDLRAALTAADVDDGLASGVAMALEHYGTTPTYLAALRDTALDAARVVAGDLDEVDQLAVAPDADDGTTVADLADLDSPVGELDESAVDPAVSGAQAPDDGLTGDESGEPEEPESTTEPSTADPESPSGDAAESDASADTSAEATDAVAEPEPTTPEPEPDDAEPTTDDLGDFSSSDVGTAGAEEAGEEGDEVGDFDAGDFEPDEFELEAEERERIEEEYGTDFSTGTEVEDPGEADIETPDPESLDDAEPAGEPGAASEPAEPESAAETAPVTESESAAEPEPEPDEPAESAAEETDSAAAEGSDEEPPEDVDVSEAVMEAMRDLDDGDGADHDRLVASVVDEYRLDADEVEDAVQDALMDGRCYEPAEGKLKPI